MMINNCQHKNRDDQARDQRSHFTPRIRLSSLIFLVLTTSALIACGEANSEVSVDDALLEASFLEIESADLSELIQITEGAEGERGDFCAIDHIKRRGREVAERRRGHRRGERPVRGDRLERGDRPERGNRPERGDRPERRIKPIFIAYDLDGDQQLNEEERAVLEDDLVSGCEARRVRLLEAFDADGDGTLSEEERSIARDAIEAEKVAERELRQTEMLDRFDADGDGELSREERHAARDTIRTERQAESVDRFDADGDGELSDDERQQMEEERSASIRERIQNGEPPHDRPRW